MRLFLDTAELEDVRWAQGLGFLAGVTTNPSIIKRTGKSQVEALQAILAITDGLVFTQVTAQDTAGMVKQAAELNALAPGRMVIKVPLVEAGLPAIVEMKKQRLNVCATAIITPAQAVLAAMAGADYVAPYVSRPATIGENGVTMVRTIAEIFRVHGVRTEILAASIKNSLDATACYQAGAHNLTITRALIGEMMRHPLTDSGLAHFQADAEATPR